MRKHPLALMDISLSHTALVLTRVPFTGQATQTEVTWILLSKSGMGW